MIRSSKGRAGLMASFGGSPLRAGSLGTGVSGLALAAALAVLTPEAARACTFAPTIDAGVVTNIAVTCADGDEDSQAFDTSFTNGNFSEVTYSYDGNGADTLTFSGGAVVQDDSGETPTPAASGGAANLNATTGTIETLGGDDRLDMDSGTIGSTAEPVSVFFGDGADTLDMTGGTIFGSVFGQGGGNTLGISGGTITGSIFAGSQDDTVTVSGTAQIQGTGADPDAIGLEDGDDTFTMTGGTVGAAVSGGAGTDELTVSGGTIADFLAGNEGDDTIVFSGGLVQNGIQGNEGDDAITLSGGSTTSVSGDAGDDTITVENAADVGSVAAGAGDDTVAVSGGTVDNSILTDSGDAGAEQGDDTVTVSGGQIGGEGVGDIRTLGGDDGVTFTGGTLERSVVTGVGNDEVQVTGGTIGGVVQTDAGADEVRLSGGSVGEGVLTGDGEDTVVVSGAEVGATGATASVELGEENDTFLMTGGSLDRGVDGGTGDDSLTVTGGTMVADTGSGGSLSGGGGEDDIVVSGGSIQGSVEGDDDDDQVAVSGGDVDETVDGGAGDDAVTVSGGTVGAYVAGGDGNDTIAVNGDAVVTGESPDSGDAALGVNGDDGDDTITVSGNAAVGGDVIGGGGDDEVTLSGGTVTGEIRAETVRLFGGTLTGDVTGLTGNTLVINDSVAPAALDLADGVSFRGRDVVGTITDTDLAAGGEAQNFTGFRTLTVDGSTLRLGEAGDGIGQLLLNNGSTLFITGPTFLVDNDSDGNGDLSVSGSTVSLVDGDPTDVLTVGGLVLDGATIGLDIDQDGGRSDTIAANGPVSATGENTILVNLVGEPEIEESIDIPIVSATGEPIGGDFAVQGIGGTTAALFSYEVVRGADGGLILRATPNNESIGTVTAVDGAASSAAADNMVDSLYGITNDVARSQLGLAGGASGASSSASAFGVFASGQLAHTEHDGFTISDGDESFSGPNFESDDFSGAISLDFNAAKYYGFDQQYGLNIGVFAGYASTDVDLDGFQGFDDAGSADNDSGMAGAYALIRKELNYLLVSGTTLFGDTDSRNSIAGSKGSYDTFGYALTASAGHIFLLGERARFDLRGGVLGAHFKGDSYTDSDGLDHDESEVSFGAVKFEPGIYADYALDNGMVLSPYARAELQQRFSYENESGVDGEHFDFDDADFSGAVMGGANLKITDTVTLSSELRGKFSVDSSTFAGKLGLKVAF